MTTLLLKGPATLGWLALDHLIEVPRFETFLPHGRVRPFPLPLVTLVEHYRWDAGRTRCANLRYGLPSWPQRPSNHRLENAYRPVLAHLVPEWKRRRG